MLIFGCAFCNINVDLIIYALFTHTQLAAASTFSIISILVNSYLFQ